MTGKLEMPRFAILIATRNRPQKMVQLLTSLCELSYQPTQVVIVSSGSPIHEEILDFQKKLNIKYSHLDQGGQIRQKIEGLKLVPRSVDWILFLDDDVLLNKNSVSNAFRYLEREGNTKTIVGIGFKNGDTVDKSSSLFKSIVSQFFGIINTNRGSVTKNGQSVDYMDSLETIETKWLNGISMWRRDIALEYNIPFLEAPYSSCEDLIFSYSASKKGRLLFIPDCEFTFQEDSLVLKQSFSVFKSTTYWRLYFVLSNKEFNVRKFLWSQVGRTISYCLVSGGRELPLAKRIWKSIGIFIDLTYLIASKTPAIKVLQLRQSGI